MTLSLVATGVCALAGSIIPSLKKGGAGGFDKAIKVRRDMERSREVGENKVQPG